MEMKFSASLKNVIFARGAVACFLLEQDLQLNVINEIKTIVSEAVTNAIVHGYQNNSEEFVFMSLSLENKELEIVIKDQGIGIENIEKAKEPLFSTREEEERAGLGFTIMDIFSDVLEVKSELGQGTTIICKKNIE
jgi:stage II sporulation protein AB (anti-sigma F factor)